MKTYTKPIAVIERFNLDSEFAGGCSIIVDPSVSVSPIEQKAYKQEIDGMLEIVYQEHQNSFYDLTILVAVYNGYDSAEALMAAGDDNIKSAVDNYTVHEINNSFDDLNSGYCYFTVAAAMGQTHS